MWLFLEYDQDDGWEQRVSIRVGYKALVEQFGSRELVEYFVWVEEFGFDSVTVSDHFLLWWHEGGHAPFALVWMAAVGEWTNWVLFGTSVLTFTFRYNPAVIAQAFATFGVLYFGCVMLGVGSGEVLNEIAVSGMEWPEFKECFVWLCELVQLIRDLWMKDGVSFEGLYYKTVDAFIYDCFETLIKVYVAVGGPFVAKYVGWVGDGFIVIFGKGMDLYMDKLIFVVCEGVEKVGKSFEDIDRMLEVKISYDWDFGQVLENTRFWVLLLLTPEQKHSVISATEMERLVDELSIEQVAKWWIVVFDFEEVVKQFQLYFEVGFNHFVVYGFGNDQEWFLTQFIEDVLFLLRKLF